MSVSSTHIEYDKHYKRWHKTRAAVSGDEDELNKLLRVPDADDHDRQREYQAGAVYQNWTGRTKNTLLGAVFRKPAEYDIPPAIESLIDECDEYGNSLDQFARSIVDNVIQVGRHGVLCDYPQAEEGLSKAQVKQLGLNPVFSEYSCENIINWRTERGRLVLVVLREYFDEQTSDGFSSECKIRYRVLKMEDGAYVQSIYDDGGEFVEEFTPTMSGGAKWPFIPFLAIGSINNDINVDEIPLLPMAVLNIAAYQNSADYEEGVFIAGQPMLDINIGDTSVEVWDKQNPNGVSFGSRRGIVTQNGSVNLIQASANSAAYEALTLKASQAVQVGARLIEKSSANQTAAAAKIEAAGEHSVLDLIAGNCSDAIKKLLEWACLFVGASPDDVEYSINRDFFDEEVDPQMLAQALNMYNMSAIDLESLQNVARLAGIIDKDRTNEEVTEGISMSSPTLGVAE